VDHHAALHSQPAYREADGMKALLIIAAVYAAYRLGYEVGVAQR
jgi:hypothetical protein